MSKLVFSIGQFLEVLGLLPLSHQFKRDHDRRMEQLARACERSAAEARGEIYEDPDSAKTTGGFSGGYFSTRGAGAENFSLRVRDS